MLQLLTSSGVLYAHVFIVDNDREIAVVLRRDSADGQIVSFETFAPQSLQRLKTDVGRWLKRRELEDKCKMELIAELDIVYEMYDAIRTNGPDIAHGWPGPASARRLPGIIDVV